MRKNRTPGFVALMFLLGVSVAPAQTVVFSGNNATGIENLDLDGVLYNVDFVVDSAVSIYGDVPDFDFNGDIEAQAANAAVIAALNTEPAVETVGPSNANLFAIGFDVENDLTFVTEGTYIKGQWVDSDVDVRVSVRDASYADFTVVPEPTAMWLCGWAMVALGVVRRRKTTA